MYPDQKGEAQQITRPPTPSPRLTGIVESFPSALLQQLLDYQTAVGHWWWFSWQLHLQEHGGHEAVSVCTAETQEMFITYLIKLCALHLQKCFALLSRPWYTFKHGHMTTTQCSMSPTDLMWHAIPCYMPHVCAVIDEKATVDNCPHWIADTSDAKTAASGALLLPCQLNGKTEQKL